MDGIPINTISERQFRANDLYDPDYAVGGHQPYGFDQVMAQYYHFTVLKSKCDLEIISNAENANVEFRVWKCNAAGVVAAAYASTGVNGMIEVEPHTKPLTITSGYIRPADRKLSIWFDAQKTFHKPYADMIGDSAYSGDDSKSPTEDAFFSICGYAPGNAAWTNASLGTMRVTITYYAAFSEPRRVAFS